MIKMKTKIIFTVIISLMLATPVFSNPQQGSGRHKSGFGAVRTRVGTQPQINTVPTQPNNPLPTPDQLYYLLTIYFDDYFPPLPGGDANLFAFMCMNVGIQTEPHHILNIETQAWENSYFWPENPDWWEDEVYDKWCFISSWFGMYDHYSSYAQAYPGEGPQMGGFRWNEIDPQGIGARVVMIKVSLTPYQYYLLNEEQFKQFLLQGYTTVLVEVGPYQNMD